MKKVFIFGACRTPIGKMKEKNARTGLATLCIGVGYSTILKSFQER